MVHLVYYSKKCRGDKNTETNSKLACVTSNESALEKRNRVRSLVIVIVLAISFLGLLSQSGVVGEAATTVTASAPYNSGGYGGQFNSGYHTFNGGGYYCNNDGCYGSYNGPPLAPGQCLPIPLYNACDPVSPAAPYCSNPPGPGYCPAATTMKSYRELTTAN
jgi:hypothetical protein